MALLLSCKQELAKPESDSNLKFFVRIGNEKPEKAITLRNGNTAIVGLAAEKGFLLVISSGSTMEFYKEAVGLGNTEFTNVIETLDNRIMTVGSTYPNEIDPTTSTIINKYSNSGELIWSNNINEKVYSLTNLENGNVLLSGETQRGHFTQTRGMLKEIDQSGKVVWTRFYSIFGSSWTSIRDTKVLSNGNFLLTCLADNTFYTTFDEEGEQVLIGKIQFLEVNRSSLNSIGNTSLGSDELVNIHKTSLLPSGLIVLADAKYHFDQRATVYKYNANREQVLNRKFSLIEPKLFVVNENEMYLIGKMYQSNGNALIIKLNKNLEEEWSVEFGTKSSNASKY